MKVDNRVTGKTKLMGVIGNPIEHSISPQLHNTINTKLDLDFIYVPFRVEQHQLEHAVNGLRALNFIGFNVTVPYKKDVIKYIDDVSKEALLMGAVNTVKMMDGKLYGYNTDAEGFSRSFKEEAGTGFKDKTVVMIGAGGAARSMAVKIAFEGAKCIYIINRTISKATEISDIVNNNVSNVVKCYSPEDDCVEEILSQSEIIINTTSVGMYPDIETSPVGENVKFAANQIIYDVVYNPVKTKFLKNAEDQGCKIINGLGMLFYQGVFAYEIWTGIKLSDELIKEAYNSYLTILNK